MKSIKPNLNRLSFFESTSSTQDEAKLWLKANPLAQEPHWFWALNQSSGRGRQNKKWFNTRLPETVMLSVALPYESFEIKKESESFNWGLLPLVAGYAVWKIFQVYNSELFLKWPNDLGLKGEKGEFCKMGGILCERFGREKGNHVVGWGVNISTQDKDLGEGPSVKDFRSISLKEIVSAGENISWELEFWVEKLVKTFESEISQWISDPFEYETRTLETVKNQAMRQYWGLKGLDSLGRRCQTQDLDESGNLIVSLIDQPTQTLTLRHGEFKLV